MRPIVIISNKDRSSDNVISFTSKIAEAMSFEIQCHSLEVSMSNYIEDIEKFVEDNDVSMFVVDIQNSKQIQFYLNKFRDVRVPYIFIKPGDYYHFRNISVPVTYLEEDKEKAPFAASFARFLKSNLIIYKPNDVGSKAERNISSFENLFSKFNINWQVVNSRSNSHKVELESAISADVNDSGMIIVSASREYGLDDVLFGPKERKIIRQSKVPVFLINPRADLYVLCD